MSSLYNRKGTKRWYADIKNVIGEWKQISTGTEDKRKAAAFVREREREVAAQLNVAGDGPLTLTRYAESWFKKLEIKTKADVETRIRKHVLPRLGAVLVIDIKPKHLRELVMALRSDGELAPATIRQVTGALHSLFKAALIDELVTANPVVFERGVLPKKIDKDPTWRAQAIYTRAEIETLLSSEKIPPDRRVLYALKFFVGRHNEVCSLTWGDYDTETKPLGRLAINDPKNKVPRAVPVHKTLAKVLAAWKLSGWEAHVGRKPKQDDFICPTSNGTKREPGEAQRQLAGHTKRKKHTPGDLDRLGLRRSAGKTRKRRGHDLRRTLITLARSDGAIDGILRLITHGPKSQDMLDVYSSPPWEVLCAEISKLKIELREGAVLQMEQA